MMKFLIVIDKQFGEDGTMTTLFDVTHPDVEIAIMEGDWYHDKIDERIEGFFEALDYLDVRYTKSIEVVNDEDEEDDN